MPTRRTFLKLLGVSAVAAPVAGAAAATARVGPALLKAGIPGPDHCPLCGGMTVRCLVPGENPTPVLHCEGCKRTFTPHDVEAFRDL